MNSKDLLSKTIDFSRFPMMVLVIFIHSYLPENIANREIPYPAFSFMFFISQTVARVAVPMFFFISGFLYFYNKNVMEPSFYRNQLIKRVPTLLIPYLLWNLFAFLFNVLKTMPIMSKFFPRMVGKNFNLTDFINAFGPFNISSQHGILGIYDPSSVPADVPLWFIRDLMVIMVFAPVLYRIFKGKIGVRVLFALSLCFLFGIWPSKCFWFNITSVYFFSFGVFMAINKINPITFFSHGSLFNGAKIWTLLFVVFSVGRVIFYQTAFANLLLAISILTGFVSFMLLCSCFVYKGYRLPIVLNKASFFMYAFHGLFISIVIKIVLQFIAPVTSLEYIITYFVIALSLIGISLITFFILSKISPTFVNILSGKRVN